MRIGHRFLAFCVVLRNGGTIIYQDEDPARRLVRIHRGTLHRCEVRIGETLVDTRALRTRHERAWRVDATPKRKVVTP